MKEFQLQVNQSLVNKTLDNFDYDPLVIVDHRQLAESTSDSTTDEEIFNGIQEEMDKYTKASLDLVEEQFRLSDQNSNQNQPLFITTRKSEIVDNSELEKLLSIDDISSSLKADLDDQIQRQELEDSIVHATEVAAQYVIHHSPEFSEELRNEAQAIIERNQTDQYYLKEVYLGFGGFLKKVWKKVTNAARTIWGWIKRQIRRVVGFGKPDIVRLQVNQHGRPVVKLGNPIIINKLNINVAKLNIHIPYYIKWPWQPTKYRTLRITVDNKLGAKADGSYHLESEELKINVTPRFTSLKIKIRLIGINFWIGLTSAANNILRDRKFTIYDVSNIATPMQVKDLEYTVSSLESVGIQDGLRLDVGIDVSQKS